MTGWSLQTGPVLKGKRMIVRMWKRKRRRENKDRTDGKSRIWIWEIPCAGCIRRGILNRTAAPLSHVRIPGGLKKRIRRNIGYV